MAAQNNAIRTDEDKAKIDKPLQNSKCRLCRDWDETIHHIISECSKLAQNEYKTSHSWLGKRIYWELCKKLKFNYSPKGYMYKAESVLENEAHKILWGFEIQTNHLILTRKPDLVIVTKKKKKKKKERTYRLVDFAVPADHCENQRRRKERQIFWPCQRTKKKKLTSIKVTVISIVIGALGTTPKNAAGRVENWRTSRHHPNSIIVKIGQNTGKYPEDLRRLSLRLQWKTFNWRWWESSYLYLKYLIPY